MNVAHWGVLFRIWGHLRISQNWGVFPCLIGKNPRDPGSPKSENGFMEPKYLSFWRWWRTPPPSSSSDVISDWNPRGRYFFAVKSVYLLQLECVTGCLGLRIPSSRWTWTSRTWNHSPVGCCLDSPTNELGGIFHFPPFWQGWCQNKVPTQLYEWPISLQLFLYVWLGSREVSSELYLPTPFRFLRNASRRFLGTFPPLRKQLFGWGKTTRWSAMEINFNASQTLCLALLDGFWIWDIQG